MDLSLLSWNVGGRGLLPQVLSEPVDVALLEEVPPPAAGTERVLPRPDGRPWRTQGWKPRAWRTAVVGVSDRVVLREIPTDALCGPDRATLAVSRPGTLTAADVVVDGAACLTVVSWYATWEHPPGDDRLLGADAGAHRRRRVPPPTSAPRCRGRAAGWSGQRL